MRDPADRALTRPRLRGAAAALAVLALAAVAVAALGAIRPPAARTGAEPAGDFGVRRAMEQIRGIAARPHPAGSTANDAVRAHLLDTLRGYGLTPEVQDTVTEQGSVLSAGAGGVALAHVRNVVALLPGTAPTGRVFLVAHYDSVQSGPGANDDGAGVATVLEVARVLASGPRPRNDVVLVLTDAEEACVCGAEAFVRQHPLARGGGVVLNVEARGSTGPAIMFETSARNAGLVGLYGAAPRPVGTSVAVEIYRLLPNDTDFSAFRRAGFTGLNSAYIDGAAVYHGPGDVPAAVDPASLQQHGDNALALARSLGAIDLARTRSGGDATYFPVPWGQLTYPGVLTWPVAIAAVVAVLALGALARRRGLASPRTLAAGFGLAAVPIVLAAVLGQVFWHVLILLRPGYAALPVDPYRPFWYRLAVLALVAAVITGWYALSRRRAGPAALAVGGLAWLALFGIALAVVAPGGSYLTALPALTGALAGVAAVLLRGGAAAVVALVAGAAAGIVVLLPTVLLLFPALGLALAGAGALLAVLLGMALLPIVDLLHPEAGGQQGPAALRARRLGLLPTLAAVLAVLALAGAGLRTDRFDAAHPIPTHLMYALDADHHTARWLSGETRPQPWTAHYVSGGAAPVVDTVPALGDVLLRSGPAEPADLPGPLLTVASQTRAGDTRTLRLLLRPQRPVRLVALHVGAGIEVTAATVGGRPVATGRTADYPWGFGFVFHAPPAEGVEVTLTVRAQGPVPMRVTDGSDGLTALPGFLPRPPGVGIAGTHTSDLVAVSRSYLL